MATESFDVIVIGSGPSGLLTALKASEKRKVVIFERPQKNFSIGKRILVSGNGRANFFNSDFLNEEAMKSDSLLKEYSKIAYKNNHSNGQELLDYLSSIGFLYRLEGKLFYPYFNRSECLLNVLEDKIKSSDIDILERKLISIDPKRKTITSLDADGRTHVSKYNSLVLSLGGKSYDRKDIENESLFRSLDIEYSEYKPALCPVRTIENIPEYLVGQRLKGHLTLKSNNKTIFEEDGELLFKKDGISGICVFDSTISLLSSKSHDFTYEFRYLDSVKLGSTNSYPTFLKRYLSYLKKKDHGRLIFHFKEQYGFEESQISYGGIHLSEVDLDTMRLKKYDSIYAIGEMLNQNFICGGYNMGMAFMEGLIAGKDLAK